MRLYQDAWFPTFLCSPLAALPQVLHNLDFKYFAWRRVSSLYYVIILIEGREKSGSYYQKCRWSISNSIDTKPELSHSPCQFSVCPHLPPTCSQFAGPRQDLSAGSALVSAEQDIRTTVGERRRCCVKAEQFFWMLLPLAISIPLYVVVLFICFFPVLFLLCLLVTPGLHFFSSWVVCVSSGPNKAICAKAPAAACLRLVDGHNWHHCLFSLR